MSTPIRHVAVTGAGGFIGAQLIRRLLGHPAFAEARISACDLHLPEDIVVDPRVRAVVGDMADAALQADLLGGDANVIFHLAGVLGGAAEVDYTLARRVNVDGTLALMETAAGVTTPPRLVFASSIAVFGPPLPEAVDDDTLPQPVMTYGAQKLMMEVALSQFAARDRVDGLALRLPGIVARPPGAAHLKSAFLNTLFHAVACGDDITLPVSPQGTTWLLSAPACVDALVHAGLLPRASLGRRRALTLPAQRVAMADLVTALKRCFPRSPSTVRYAPDADIEAQFAQQPPLRTARADALGFRHDGDIDTLIARALDRPADGLLTRTNP